LSRIDKRFPKANESDFLPHGRLIRLASVKLGSAAVFCPHASLICLAFRTPAKPAPYPAAVDFDLEVGRRRSEPRGLGPQAPELERQASGRSPKRGSQGVSRGGKGQGSDTEGDCQDYPGYVVDARDRDHEHRGRQ